MSEILTVIHRLVGDYLWTYQGQRRWTMTDEAAIAALRAGQTTTRGRAYGQGLSPAEWLARLDATQEHAA